MKEDDPLLKTAQVQELLNISRDKVLQMVEEGTLRAIKLGPKTIRIFESSVMELFK